MYMTSSHKKYNVTQITINGSHIKRISKPNLYILAQRHAGALVSSVFCDLTVSENKHAKHAKCSAPDKQVQ